MTNPDQSRRFLFEDYPIRGQHVSLDESWKAIAKQSGQSGRGLNLLGEALAAVSLLVDTLKIDGSITLQIQGKGPLSLLVVEANSKQQLRGIVRGESELDQELELKEVFGSEYIVITIHAEGAEPHQGIAALRGKNLSEALEHYFATSEQLPTRFWLSCNPQQVRGMLIQKLPGKSSDDDAWDRVQMLSETITMDELQEIPIEQLLHRLFHEETIRLFDPNSVEFFCSCSRERTGEMLISLGRSEANEILAEEDAIEVTCEFCNANYRFDSIDVEQIFLTKENTAVPVTSNTTSH